MEGLMIVLWMAMVDVANAVMPHDPRNYEKVAPGMVLYVCLE